MSAHGGHARGSLAKEPPRAYAFSCGRQQVVHRQMVSRRSIGRLLQMPHRTVISLADAAKTEDLFRGQWQYNKTSVLDEYKSYLGERCDEGCTDAW
ncbi:hypothetical protein [Streptomyces sp. DSM 118148]|uniref:hypothetical protein n=1 Tax=Streptomyces sp. DSM 118148 TaxID=3448667 RepID=UPI00403FEC06